jgi:hypothetical protein
MTVVCVCNRCSLVILATFIYFNLLQLSLSVYIPNYCIAGEDIIDETLTFFRANCLFRNFDVRGGADRTLIYLTLHAMQCLVKCEKIEDKASGMYCIQYLYIYQL